MIACTKCWKPLPHTRGAIVGPYCECPPTPRTWTTNTTCKHIARFLCTSAMTCIVSSCAPQTNMTFGPNGRLLSVSSHQGFLHRSKVSATEIQLPGGGVIKHLIQEADGTSVANNALLAAGSAYVTGANLARDKVKEITKQKGIEATAAKEQAIIAAEAEKAKAAAAAIPVEPGASVLQSGQLFTAPK